MRILFLLLFISSVSYGQLLTGVAGTVRKPRPPAAPQPEFVFWASFSEDDSPPIASPYTVDTGQEMTVVQSASNIFIQGNELKKSGAGGYGTNTLTASTAISRETGYCLSFKFQYTTGGVIGGFLQTGVTAHTFQVSSNKLLTSDRFSLADINYVLTPGTNYTGFLIVRPAGMMWVFNEGSDFYMTYISSKYTYANLNQYLDLASTSSVDWMRGEIITGAETDFDLATFSNADATDGMEFTHSDGWIVYSLSTKAATTSEIQFRKKDATNYLKLTVATTNVAKLIEVIDGVETQKGSDFTISQADEYRIFLNGTDVRVFGNSSTALLVQATTTLSGTDGELVTQGGGNISAFNVYPFSISNESLINQLINIQSVSEPVNDVVEREIFVSAGATSGDGTEGNPYTWAQALGDATPGTTVTLQAGTYSDITGTINAFGTVEYPVTIKPEVGAHVILDFSNDFYINGSDVIFDGTDGKFELMTDAWTGDRFLGSQNFDAGVFGSRSKLINCILHDFGNVGYWSTSTGAEMYGCLIYNIGRGNGSQGHPLYTQNNIGTKEIRNNIFIQTFNSAFTMHLYGSGSSTLKGYIFDKNITLDGRFLCGSAGSPVEDVEITNCIHAGTGQMEIGQIGLADPLHNGIKINDNKFWGTTFQVKRGTDFEILDNEFDGSALTTVVINNTVLPMNIDGNVYQYGASEPSNKWQFEAVNYTTFAAWKAGTGFDLTGSYTSGTIPDSYVVIPNTVDTRRASIAIKNLSEASTVSVDLSTVTGLVIGQRYTLLNAQNPEEYLDFNYTGAAVEIPMTGWTVSQPIGTNAGTMPPKASTFPAHGYFYLMKDVKVYFENVVTDQTASTISVDFDVLVPETPAKPTVGTVTVTGTEEDGNTLTATYSDFYSASGYSDASTWQWYRADDNQSLGSAIVGATNSTYILTQDDVAKNIRAVLTPTDDIGTVGDPVTSIYTGQIADDEFNPITDIAWFTALVPAGAVDLATNEYWRNDGTGGNSARNASDAFPVYDSGDPSVDFELSNNEELTLDIPSPQYSMPVEVWVRIKFESFNAGFSYPVSFSSAQRVEQRASGAIYLSGATCDYTAVIGDWTVMRFVISGVSNTSEFNVNNGTNKTDVGSVTTAFGTSDGRLGANNGGTSNRFDGKISHLFVKSGELSTDEETAMWAWFAANANWD